jgi:hypothetical protein
MESVKERWENLRWMMGNGIWNKSAVDSLQLTRNKGKTENVIGEKLLKFKSESAFRQIKIQKREGLRVAGSLWS